MATVQKTGKLVGRDFIQMIKPLFGLEHLKGIREITIHAHYADVTHLTIETIPDIDLSRIEVTEDPLYPDDLRKTRRYTVEVTEIKDD